MRKKLLLISGSPGSGKTSVLLKTVEALRARGYSVGGMISHEIRTSGKRVGFEILDMSSGEKGWLAHINQKHGPQIGRYRVNLKDLNDIGVQAVANAVEEDDVVVIDEIGPMELYSEGFRKAVWNAVESEKLVISTVHWKLRNKLAEEIRTRGEVETFIVTFENRGAIYEDIVIKAVEFLKKVTGDRLISSEKEAGC